jgi:hypothetical protein
MMFLYLSEVLPDVGMSIVMLLDWILVFLVVQFFLDLSEAIEFMGVFLIFAGVCLVMFLFYWPLLIESKGRSKSEMLSLYSGIRETEVKPVNQIEEMVTVGTSSPVNIVM